MSGSDEGDFPLRLGDGSGGPYWSAEPLPWTAADERAERARPVHGRLLRFMWDYGVRMPLWDDEGLLPEDDDWLRESLGVDRDLIRALRRWSLEMIEIDAAEPSDDSEERTRRYEQMDAAARDLVERLRDQVDGALTVAYERW